jgi:dinuclear metal center YbgI/SA1388 family protein
VIETTFLADYLDELLEISRIPDYPGAVNGLQLGNTGKVRKVAAAVDFSSRTAALAIEQQADLLIVHHGMFWSSGAQPITGWRLERLRSLIENNVAVYSSHLPLDCHSTFGNNTLLSRELGLEPTGPFAHHQTISIGVSGTSELPTTDLIERARAFAVSHGGNIVTAGFDTRPITGRWAMCTGAGASADTLREASERDIETLIVGEGPHWTAVEAAELGITIIYAGHYATETLGVKALARHVAEHFGLDWSFLHVPTGL